MMDNFALAARNYRKKYKETKDKAERKILRSQVEAFFQLIDTYLATLEMFYQKRGFDTAHERAYEDRMHYRKDYAYFAGKHLKHMGHFFLDKTSRYGHSFGRWGITVVVFISFFAGLFALLDAISSTSMLAHYDFSSGSTLVDYLYFSIVTFTTLGYGDIVPITAAEKLLCGFEVLTGFIMLGVLINLIKRRL
jgi:voltage-gated potassium channel Kch